MRFEILPAAETDLAEQYAYLSINASEATADRLLMAAGEAFSAIKQRPQIGTPCSVADSALADMRSWPIQGFPSIRAYYVQQPNLIQVVRVLHGKRDLERLLTEYTASDQELAE